ncbi:MAG: sigma 54-interacting transcriptional regulator [Candidatus Cloacimonetes bacterium]|nr:sigma 54-interacting transcriptional regulator [Candidatus Cloacimonadota bacterium]
MENKLEKVIDQFVIDKNSTAKDVIKTIEKKKSKIIEVIGGSGSGKSAILSNLRKIFKDKDITVDFYVPRIYQYNHFKQILQLLTNLNDKEYNALITDSSEYDFKNKYDLFYFISETLTNQDLLKDKIILIYENAYLDEYTRDFIKYIVQYADKQVIQFIIFSEQETFPFSQKILIESPGKEQIASILKTVQKDKSGSIASESEIIYNISNGNLFIVDYIINNLLSKNKTFDFDSFLKKKVDIETILTQYINDLKPEQRKLLFIILLLDTSAPDAKLKQICKAASTAQDLKILQKKRLIIKQEDNYYVKKAAIIKKHFENLPKKKRLENFELVSKVIKPEFKNDLCVILGESTSKCFDECISKLSKLNDYDSLITIQKLYIKQISKPEKKIDILYNLGTAFRILSKLDLAAEYFRRTLKIAVENSLSLDKLVYGLAETLYIMNSSAFALEVLKKYTEKPDELELKLKTNLLKADILLDLEKMDEVKELTENSLLLIDKIRDADLRNKLKADFRKLKGKIAYYSDDWKKAETEFIEAEKLYTKVNNTAGLAAIYNNLGVLAMFQGEMKKAESLYQKSLKAEKQRYNLSGISTSQSNLGSLYEDKGDYKRSLECMHEALRLQLLINDRDQIPNIYLNIGVSYMNNGRFEKAEEAFNNSLAISVEYNMYKNIIPALNNLGALFFKSGNFKKAISYYEQAVKKSQDANFTEGIIKSYNNIGELFEKRGEYNLAHDYYAKSIELLPSISDEYMKAELYGNMGSVLTAMHKFKEAYAYLVESYEFFKGLNAKDKIIEGALNQASYFIETRNFESANYYLETVQSLAEEIDNDHYLGQCTYLSSLLEKENRKKAMDLLRKAIEYFVKSNSNIELAEANYDFANLLLEEEDWEQALQILKDNIELIKGLGAIKILERNEILIKKVSKKYSTELKESKVQETILNKFYEITQELNDISDFDTLINTAINKLIEFSEAKGGLFTLYNNKMIKDSWEYVIPKGIGPEDEDFPQFMDLINETFSEGTSQNYKQPHFAPEYNNIIIFPLIVRNDKKGVVCLFTKHGSHYFTEKMFNLISALCNQIVVIVENITYENLQKSHEIIREELASFSTFANIIGKSNKIQHIFRMIEKIKNTPTSILLEGPSGTGKELIARAIHYNSNRRNKKFIAQYCGALPETLLESELFGHVKGSFTGATHDKKGLFEVADGGTFFLDEIADISLSTQVKLLRFLQEGEIKRVGSTQTHKVDVRVICATNVSLKEKVDSGGFRLDLFYRLNVIKVDVPSLKERKSDIPLLAVHFLDKYCKSINKKVNGITEEAMKYLMNYSWPGNIRQLENEIERAITLAEEDSSIKSSDLSEDIFHYKQHTKTVQLLENRSMKDAVEKLEKEMILKALEEHEDNQTKAAKALSLSRQGLIKKMQRYGIKK